MTVRRFLLAPAVMGVILAGCAPRLVPSPLAERRSPVALLARLEAYNRGARAVRIVGTLRVSGKGNADFGATSVAGVGLRIDVVAGPFATPVVALACLAGERCSAYVPSEDRVYLDPTAQWEQGLGELVRGRVPELSRKVEAWQTEQGKPVLLFRAAQGWLERVEFDSRGRLPSRVFLEREGEEPLARIAFSEFALEPLDQPFPTRIEVRLGDPEQTYELIVRRIEPAAKPDAKIFTLSVPPGTEEVTERGRFDWKEKGLPPWLPLLLHHASTPR